MALNKLITKTISFNLFTQKTIVLSFINFYVFKIKILQLIQILIQENKNTV